jgi:uncharacterized protein YdgA (DUF945 family)
VVWTAVSAGTFAQKPFILVTFAAAIVSLGAGHFLGTSIEAAAQTPTEQLSTKKTTSLKVINQYNGVPENDERLTTTTTITTEIHSHDGIPRHQHVQIITIAINETTPDGVFYDFAANAAKSTSR